LLSKKKSRQKENFLLKTYKAEIILLFVTFSWGLTFPLIKISLEFISPVFFISIRFFIALILFCLLFRRKIIFSDFSKWKYGIILGIFIFFGFAFQTVGLKFTTASKSAFITGTSLIIIPFAQYFILKHKPKPENIAGAIVVIAGLYILSESYLTKPNTGDILTLFCATAFAIHIVLLDKYSRVINFNYLVFGQFLTMTILSLIFMLIFEVFIYDDLYINLSTDLIFPIFYTSVFSILMSIILMTKYQHETTPLRAGIIYNMESLFAVFFAFILLGEILNLNQIIGAIIMLLGLFVSEFCGLIKIKISNAKES
jgi:drug/metabolite transporter (DMT)-like permease